MAGRITEVMRGKLRALVSALDKGETTQWTMPTPAWLLSQTGRLAALDVAKIQQTVSPWGLDQQKSVELGCVCIGQSYNPIVY